MEELLAGAPNFFQTFNLGKFIASISGFLFVVYLVIAILLAVKAYRDAGKRFNDKLLVFVITLLVFTFSFIGYFFYSLLKPKQLIHEQHISSMEKYFLEYETRGIGKCKVCKYVYFPEHTFCVNCGSLVRTKCSMCSNIIELDWKVCPYCGDKKRIVLDKNQIAISSNALTGIENISN